MRQGFSLVELSIVLVILGLLTGGILAGQSLIRAAELRAVVTERDKYVAALHTFRDKYFAIPGDFRDATKFWGFAGTAAAPGCVSNSGITAVTAPGTCDGNGDGVLAIAGATSATGEMFQIWKQLALAGLIEGTYAGLANAVVSNGSDIGGNIPRSKLNQGGWNLYALNLASHPQWTNNNYGNVLFIGAVAGGGGSSAYSKLLRPEEAWNIDTKTDDGKPQIGKVWAIHWDDCTTATGFNVYNGDYDLRATGIECALAFPNML